MTYDFSSNRGVWFSTKRLRRGIDLKTWDLALSLYIAQKVSCVTIEQLGDTWEVTAEVEENARRSYEVRVDLMLTDEDEVDDWEGVCTCAQTQHCKHTVAVMIEASQRGLSLMGVKSAAVIKPVPLIPVQCLWWYWII